MFNTKHFNKLFVWLAAIFISANYCCAQSELGLRYGLNLSTIKKTDSLQFRVLRPGVAQSLIYNKIIRKKILIGMELLVNQLGNNSYVSSYDIISKTNVKKAVSYSFDYLCMPLKIGIKSNTKKKYFIANIAACPSYLIGSTVRLYNNGIGAKIPLQNVENFNLGAYLESGIGINTYDNFSISITAIYFESFGKNIYAHRAYNISVGILYKIVKNVSKTHF